jgi:phage baseplate assembly protein gpV
MGQDLLEFRPRVTSSEQVKEVQVRGWDPARKEKLVGTAPAAASSAKLSTDPAALAAKFGSPSYVMVDRPLGSQSAVDGTAKAVAEQIGTAFAEADGVARGNPALRAGKAFSVSVVAADFVGQYVPSATRHVFDKWGYRTEFTVSGRQERSLLGLATGGGGGAAGGSSAVHGMVVAKVTANDDPDKLGRVKLMFPWLSDDYESDWARVVQLGAGPDSGAVFLPEVHDEVLVAFEFGDVRRPYVLGGLYNGVDKPRLGDGLFDNGKVKRRGFVSRKGHRFVLFDDAGKSGIALLSSDGKLRLSLNETTGEIHIYGDPKVTIEAKNIKLKADIDLSLEAPKIAIKADAAVDIDGGMITLN